MLVHQILREAGYNGILHSYETASEDGASHLPLDPITVAGQCRVQLMMRDIKFLFVKDALSLILESKSFEVVTGLQPSIVEADKRTRTAKRWKNHLEQLTQFRILRKIQNPKHAYFHSPYFSVPKADQQSARAILNAKQISRLSKNPPAVRLPNLPDVLRRIDSLKPRYIGTGDFRHWFHQIPLAEQIQRYFTVTNGQQWNWCTLPMGYSFSPYIAQSVGWEVLLKDQPYSPHLHDSRHMPCIVDMLSPFGQTVGFMTLFYDNIIIVSSNPEIGERCMKQMKINANYYNVALKTTEARVGQQLFLREGTEGIKYIGVEIGIAPKSTTRNKRESRLIWRLSKPIKETDVIHLLRRCTPRTVYRVIGAIVWHTYASLQSFGSINQVLAIMSDVATTASTTSWDTEMNFSESNRQIILHHARRAADNDWCTITETEQTETWATTDASGWGYAMCIYDGESDRLRECKAHKWQADMSSKDIFRKELYAGIQCVELILATQSNTRIILGQDNEAVFLTMSHFFSNFEDIQKQLTSLHEKLVRHTCALKMVKLSGKCNVSDKPSRGLPLSETVRQQCKKAMVAELLGNPRSTHTIDGSESDEDDGAFIHEPTFALPQ